MIDQLSTEWWFPTDACREAAARCLHLLERGTGCGVLTGAAGCGKSLIIKRLARQAARLTHRAFVIDASGLDAAEFRWRLCGGLRLNPSVNESRTSLWMKLTDSLTGGRVGQLSTSVLIDHADRAEESFYSELRRWLQLADDHGSIITIVSSRSPMRRELVETVYDFCDLRADVPSLSSDETLEFLKSWSDEEAVSPRAFTPGAMQMFHTLTGGEPRKLQKLARLAALASAAEGGEMLDADALEDLRRELSL